jgi:hypothetical protein
MSLNIWDDETDRILFMLEYRWTESLIWSVFGARMMIRASMKRNLEELDVHRMDRGLIVDECLERVKHRDDEWEVQ